MKRQLITTFFQKRVRIDEQCSSTSAEVETEDKDVNIEKKGAKTDQSDSISVELECQCFSCSKGSCEKPYQPSKFDYSSTSINDGKQTRKFQVKWFEMFAWLSFCTRNRKVFCYFCQKNAKLCLTNLKSSRSDPGFVENGFGAWKRAIESFKTHEKSHSHVESVENIYAISKTVPIMTQLSTQLLEDQSKRRKQLIKTITSLGYLARQGLAIRGHTDEESNFIQLIKLRGEDDSDISKMLEGANHYLSHEVLNEMLSIMYRHLMRKIIFNIQESKWFGIIADETSDVSGREQFSLSIRWVDDDTYDIHEDLIGLVEVSDTSAETLTKIIRDVLIRCGLDLKNCRGQAYDGAANMSGAISGVATRIRNEVPAALQIHCAAHILQLCLQDISSNAITIREALNFCTELYQLIKLSPKRLHLFEDIQNCNNPNGPTLKPTCPTRWTVRNKSFKSILDNFETLENTLEEISRERNEPGRKATGLLAMMEKFSTYFGLYLAYEIFIITELCSKELQRSDINAETMEKAVTITKTTLQNKRENFEEVYSKITEKADHLNLEPTLPRRKKIPKKLDERPETRHEYQSAKEYYRAQYFEAYDLVISAMNKRFDGPTLLLLKDIESIVRCSIGGKQISLPPILTEIYSEDIDFDLLKTQLQMLPAVLGTNCKNSKVQIIREIATRIASEMQDISKTMFSEVQKLIKLYLTVPMTSVTAERSFSALRRLKTYLRSTMTQERLNHLLVLHCHKELLDEVMKSPVKIAQEFATANSRRMEYYGKF